MSNTLALRDRAIDFLFLHFPVLLQDDLVLEAIVCFIVAEVRRCAEEPEDRCALMRLQDDGCPHGGEPC